MACWESPGLAGALAKTPLPPKPSPHAALPGAQKRRVPFPGVREGAAPGPPCLRGVCLHHKGSSVLGPFPTSGLVGLPGSIACAHGSPPPPLPGCLQLCSLSLWSWYLGRLSIHAGGMGACPTQWPSLGARIRPPTRTSSALGGPEPEPHRLGPQPRS